MVSYFVRLVVLRYVYIVIRCPFTEVQTLGAVIYTTHEPLLANYAVIEPVNARAVHYTESAHATKWPT